MTVSAADTNQTGSFNNLNTTLNEDNYQINLTGNYTYYPTTDNDLHDGLFVSGNHIIDGNNYSINANNSASILKIGVNNNGSFTPCSVVLKNINFINANSTYGAVYVAPGSSAYFINCTFTNNHAISYGGAIFAENCSKNSYHITLDDCNFINNSAGVKGGAVYTLNSNIKVTRSNFNGNLAGEAGGAIFCNLADAEITGSNFTNNQAPTGGAVDIISADVKDSKFINNSATSYDGGAIYAVYNLNVINSEFLNNYAQNTGGAIYNTISVNVKGSRFVNNTGTVYAVKNCNLTGNVLVNNNLHGQYTIFAYSNTTICADYNWWGNNNPFNMTDLIGLSPYTGGQTSYTPNNWIIMTQNIKDNIITTSLNSMQDKNGSNTSLLNNIELPLVHISYNSSTGLLNPEGNDFTGSTITEYTPLNNSGENTVNSVIDNQTLTLNFNTEKVNTILTLENLTKNYNTSNNLTGKLQNTNNKPLNGEKVILNLTRLSDNKSKTYIVTTNVNGDFYLEINLSLGLYTAKATYNGNTEYSNNTNILANITILIDNKTGTKIIAEDFNHKVNAGLNYTGKLYDVSNNPINGQIVGLKLTRLSNNQTKTYYTRTDEHGQFQLPINLAIGEYSIFSSYNGTSKYAPSSSNNIIIIKS